MMVSDTFLDATRATLFRGTLPTLNLPMKSLATFDVILVSSYHNYKEKKIRLLPYHSFYGGHIPQEKLSPLSWQSA